jgi:hypothetical protein
MDPITALTAIPAVGPYIPYVVTAGVVAAAVATVLPPPAPNGSAVYVAIYKAVNWLALNIGKAKNQTPPQT